MQNQQFSAAPAPRRLDANQVNTLTQQGFSSGLIQGVSVNADRFPLRIWVVDNSSSMQVSDAHVIRGSTLQGLQTIQCTRWQEAQESVTYFAHMAATFNLPTRFVMLNDNGRSFGPSEFSIGEKGPAEIPRDYQQAQSIIARAYPSGATPLTQHIQQIRQTIVAMAPQLQQRGQVVSVILATDGLPSDVNGNEGKIIFSQFVDSLRSLEGLPVWVVVRLCTDDEKVFDFYNSIDQQILLPYEVLDDFSGEAVEVYLRNPWFTYALPLHRFRESGFYVRALDALDERTLSYVELQELCSVIMQYGNTLPDPAADWLAFLRALAQLMSREPWHYNSVTRSLSPWIDLRRLHLVYGRNLPFPPELQQPIQQSPSMPAPQRQPSLTRTQQQSPLPNNQRAQVPRSKPAASPPKAAASVVTEPDLASLKHSVLRGWATTPKGFLKPLADLLLALPTTFRMVQPQHAYFSKWKPLSSDAIQPGGVTTPVVMKRAVRKVKFFLHPDKLPHDLNKQQAYLCQLLWDVIADALEEYGKQNP